MSRGEELLQVFPAWNRAQGGDAVQASWHSSSAECSKIETLIQKPHWSWKGEFPQTFSPSLVLLVLIGA